MYINWSEYGNVANLSGSSEKSISRKYGEDGSETFDAFNAKEAENKEQASATFSNSLGDLKKNIEYLIGMERQSGSMDVITPLYVSRMLNVPLE